MEVKLEKSSWTASSRRMNTQRPKTTHKCKTSQSRMKGFRHGRKVLHFLTRYQDTLSQLLSLIPLFDTLLSAFLFTIPQSFQQIDQKRKKNGQTLVSAPWKDGGWDGPCLSHFILHGVLTLGETSVLEEGHGGMKHKPAAQSFV
jgi:hypothetical protein